MHLGSPLLVSQEQTRSPVINSRVTLHEALELVPMVAFQEAVSSPFVTAPSCPPAMTSQVGCSAHCACTVATFMHASTPRSGYCASCEPYIEPGIRATRLRRVDLRAATRAPVLFSVFHDLGPCGNCVAGHLDVSAFGANAPTFLNVLQANLVACRPTNVQVFKLQRRDRDGDAAHGGGSRQ